MPRKKRPLISNPFDIATHKTERSGAAVLMHWARTIIEENNIDLGLPDIETGGGDRKFPDTIINKTRRSKDVLCVLEFKPPFWDVLNEDDPKEPARKKATSRHAKYFATSNFRELVLWSTEKANAAKPEEEQIVARYHLSDIFDLDKLEEHSYKVSIKKGLEKFLRDLSELSTGKKTEPRLAIDELLILRLHEKIQKLAYYYRTIIYDQAHKDEKFQKDLKKWFSDQGWSFYIENEEDYDKIARQTAYLLVNKILFYNALQLKRPQELDPLSIPEDITLGNFLQIVLEAYFKQVLNIDYETVYTTDFIDEVAFLGSREVVEEVKELVRVLRRYKLEELGFDIVGRIFEKLIPDSERHDLGQYFTSPDVIDLILNFCSKHEIDKILDPSCGAGTFLVRAYQHKKVMNQRLEHEEILDTLWGNDIAKFPAHLSTINLAIKDLSKEKNYPNIIQKDFFDLLVSPRGFELPTETRKVKARTLGVEEREVIWPRKFDCVVGNPPYTRQEEISEISDEKSYKEKLIQKALFYGHQKIANLSKRAGIYAYFFIHGAKFLKNGGRFGFIVSNAWLDVEYGGGLQEFFLKNFKIVAIVESKVERWFSDADINTSIVILEKADDPQMKTEREENLVRFVYLKKPLRHFIPPAQDRWDQEIARRDAIKKLINTIQAHSEFYENEELRVFPKKQKELWEEGFDEETKTYSGAKWGKYIRAPQIFFTILEKGKDKFVPLKKVADVRFGIKTGANEFFYLTEEEIKRRKIEKEFWTHKDEKGNLVPNYVIKSPRECKSILVNPKDLKYRVLMIHKDRDELKGTNVLKYIREGERKGYHKRPTCASRERWWDLEEIGGNVLCMMSINERHIWWNNDVNCFIDARLYGAEVKNSKDRYLGVILNSTLFWLFTELWGRVNLGEGALDVKVYEYKTIPILELNDKLARKAKDKNIRRPIINVMEEIGTKNSNSINLSKIKKDRRVLDQFIMGDILGLSEDEQLEVYKAVVDLVRSRLARAKSAGNNNKKNGRTGINIDAVVDSVVSQIGEGKVKKWRKEKILSQKKLKTVKLPEMENEARIEKSLFGWQIKNGKKVISCASRFEARYLKIWLELGAESVKVPEEEKYLKKCVLELEKMKSEIDEKINSLIGSILDRKLKKIIFHQIWQRL